MNKTMLIGNLGRDPELSYTNSGKAIARFSLAVNRRVKNGDNWTDETEWFNIIAWDNLAERCNNYLRKGTKVFIEGRLQQRKYNDKEGVQRLSVEVVANDMEILTPKSQSHSSEDFISTDGDLDDQPF
jgi:single-strand DNA-binding protein